MVLLTIISNNFYSLRKTDGSRCRFSFPLFFGNLYFAFKLFIFLTIFALRHYTFRKDVFFGEVVVEVHIFCEEDISGFCDRLRDEEKSKNTVEKYIRDVKRFCEFIGERGVCKEIVLEYKTEIMRSYSVASVNSMLASLNAFFKFCGWYECCVKFVKEQKTSFCSEAKMLTQKEYRRLVSAAYESGNERLALVIQTVCATGIRISELEYITVEAVQRGETSVNLKGKIRKIFIVKSLQKLLLNYVKKNKIKEGSVFVTHSGNPLNRSNVWRDMKKLCENANVNPQKVFPHNLRHLFARMYFELEKDIAKLADLLGHSNINTTRIYTMTDGTEIKRKLEKMHLIL